jgi:hypothetical protein
MLVELEMKLGITIHFSVEADYRVMPRVKRRRKDWVDPNDIKVFDPEKDFLD